MNWFLIVVAALHLVFMCCELFPWSFPVLLRIVSKKLPVLRIVGEKLSNDQKWTDSQQTLVATIVHNAGIYNAILAGGLFWAAFAGEPARDAARVLLVGATVAGAFGTATLRSPLTALQAVLGIIGVALV